MLFTDFETDLPSDVVPSLERRARQTGASIVGPMYLERRYGDECVHMAGGRNRVVDDGETRHLDEGHLHGGRTLDQMPVRSRAATEQVEFHCMLARRDVFEHGLLDEDLKLVREHLDFCLRVRRDGGEVWLNRQPE